MGRWEKKERDGIWKGKTIKENWYDWHSVLDNRSSLSLDSEGSSSNLKSKRIECEITNIG